MNTLMKTRLVMTLSYVGVLLILALSTWATKPDAVVDNALAAALVLFIVKALPLLLFIPGLIQGGSRAAAWLCYMTLIYFIFAILFFFTKGGEFWGGLMSINCIVLFISAMLYTRWKKPEEQPSN